MFARVIAVIGLAALVGLQMGCNPFRRQRQPKVPPAVTPAPVPPAAAQETERTAPAAAAWEFPPPPEVAPAEPATIAPPPIEAQFPAPPPRRPDSRREVAAKPEPEPEPEAPKPPPMPRLTQLLTPEEERKYNQEIDNSLERARQNAALIAQRPLKPEQQVVLERVHAFLQQTVEVRTLDLVTARSLAQRADLLARDLERSTR